MEVSQSLTAESLVLRECRSLCGSLGIDFPGEFAEHSRFITEVLSLSNPGHSLMPSPLSAGAHPSQHPRVPAPSDQDYQQQLPLPTVAAALLLFALRNFIKAASGPIAADSNAE